MATATISKTGWCGTGFHPKHDHLQTSSCVAFISDAENTEALLREARLQDARTRLDQTVEARYVAAYRSY